MTERRVSCLLCAGRCDPARYTCENCHRRIIQAAIEKEIEYARSEANQAAAGAYSQGLD